MKWFICYMVDGKFKHHVSTMHPFYFYDKVRANLTNGRGEETDRLTLIFWKEFNQLDEDNADYLKPEWVTEK